MKYNFEIFKDLQEVKVFCAKNVNKIEVISLVPHKYYCYHNNDYLDHYYNPINYLLTYKNIEKE